LDRKPAHFYWLRLQWSDEQNYIMTTALEATDKDFERMMQMRSAGVTRLVDASTVKLAVDIGSASGTLVHTVMTSSPHLHGIDLDLPDVVPSATAATAVLGFAERSRVLYKR
jgi:O-methyltransferase domain